MSADHLFYVSRANIFSIYPKILKEILICEELVRRRESLTSSVCYLPSDFDWQMRMYFWLLDRQKIINAYAERGEVYHDTSYKPNKILWETIDLFESCMTTPDQVWTESVEETKARRRPRCVSYDLLSYCNADALNLWDLHDYNCAGKLLMKPQIVVDFVDEYEMRKVYSLIYDVYRHKLVLNQALTDVALFDEHPNLAHEQPRVWLLLFELHCRKFNKRDPEATKIMNQLFVESKLLEIEAILWKYKTRLAASLTRLRIQSNALVLSQLLPKHLQDNKVALAVSCPILTGFVNNFKKRLTKKETIVIMEDLGYIEQADDTKKLLKNEYKWDKVCPQFLTLYPVNRNDFVNSYFMTNSEFIIQDRGFSVGPAIFAKLLDILDLRGDVVQTHVLSPRSTAYLASLLMNNDRVNRFIVFGAGNKLEELEKFMARLGVNNIVFMSEGFTELTATASILQRVVAIFATPPSSFSGISDPIDLICSRGGDLSMLEVLSESEMTYAGQERVSQVLTEQRETLKKAMSRSYTQYVLYETHSLVQSENEEMVQKTIEFMNRRAHDKHVRIFKEKEKEKEKHNQAPAVAEPPKKVKKDPFTRFKEAVQKILKRRAAGGDPFADTDTESESETESVKLKQQRRSQNVITEEDYARVKVPDTDLFCTHPLPDLCQNRDRCLDLAGQGCYLALLQRKEVVRLDSKYLIKMAEVRGIFGDADKSKKTKSSSQKRMEKRAEEMKMAAKEHKTVHRSDSNLRELIERINAPTQASVKRGHTHRMSTATKQFLVVDLTHACQRHARRHRRRQHLDDTVVTYMQMVRESEQSRVKQWWQKTVEHIGRLRARGDTTLDCLEKAKDCPLVLRPHKRRRKRRNRVRPKEVLTVPVMNLEF